MEASQATDLLLALLSASIATIIVVRGRRFARRLSVPMLVLAGFFAIRALARLLSALGVEDTGVAALDIAQVLDVLLVVALVAILFTIERVLRGVAAVEDSARYREVEYERARRHYTQVVRHRMMNPITAIRGSAVTLRDVPGIAEPERSQLLDSIVDGCDLLVEVSLEPERRDDLERDLDAVPRIERDRRRTPYPDGPPGPS